MSGMNGDISGTVLYGLVGRRLGHSFSRRFFTEKFASLDIDARYDNYELDSIGMLPRLIESAPALRGLNVTIPYKESVIPFLSRISDEAREIGAVNTIVVTRHGGEVILAGHNTDAAGFRDTLLPHIGGGINCAIVLGSGGASKAVVFVLRRLGLSPLIVSRTPGHVPGAVGYSDLTPRLIASHRLIVNTTPLGMWPDTESCPDIPYDEITPSHLCYDLVYNPSPTMFLKRCAARGASTVDGTAMLRAQALASWELWNQRYISEG